MPCNFETFRILEFKVILFLLLKSKVQFWIILILKFIYKSVLVFLQSTEWFTKGKSYYFSISIRFELSWSLRFFSRNGSLMSHFHDVIKILKFFLKLCTGKGNLFVPFSDKSIDAALPGLWVLAWSNIIEGKSMNESGVISEISGFTISIMECNQIVVKLI